MKRNVITLQSHPSKRSTTHETTFTHRRFRHGCDASFHHRHGPAGRRRRRCHGRSRHDRHHGRPDGEQYRDLPADVDVVAGEEKRKRQGASLGETLDHLSGVDTIATGTNVGKPVLRGFSGNRVRVLSNGIGLDFQQFGVRHMPTVDPFVADRIEVVRGAQSLLYGSGALGGAVNLLPTLPPTGPEGEWTLNGETTLEYQSAYEQVTGVQKLSGANGRLGFAATIVGRDSGGLNTPGAPGRLQPAILATRWWPAMCLSPITNSLTAISISAT